MKHISPSAMRWMIKRYEEPTHIMRNAWTNFGSDKENVLLTAAEHWNVYPCFRKKNLVHFSSLLGAFAEKPALLVKPEMVGALQKTLLATTFKMVNHYLAFDGTRVTLVPKVLEVHLFPFLKKYYSHIEVVENLEKEIANASKPPRFTKLDQQAMAFGPLQYSYFEEEANDPQVVKTPEYSREYALCSRLDIADYAVQGSVLKYPHNVVLYRARMNTLYNMLTKSSLSSQDARGLFIASRNYGWYGCEDKSLVEEAGRVMVEDSMIVSKFLIHIERDVIGHFGKYGFMRLSVDEEPKVCTDDFRIFRA